MAGLRLSGLTLGVADLERARRFWVDGVGLRVTATYERQIAVDLGGCEICLDRTGEIAPAPGLELVVGCDRAGFDALLASLARTGARVVRPARDYGGPLGLEAAVSDPDGHLLVPHVPRQAGA